MCLMAVNRTQCYVSYQTFHLTVFCLGSILIHPMKLPNKTTVLYCNVTSYELEEV